jgi:hypothetical protein
MASITLALKKVRPELNLAPLEARAFCATDRSVAMLDALSDIGIEHMDTPATPHRVWSAIRAARDGPRDSQR